MKIFELFNPLHITDLYLPLNSLDPMCPKMHLYKKETLQQVFSCMDGQLHFTEHLQ